MADTRTPRSNTTQTSPSSLLTQASVRITGVYPGDVSVFAARTPEAAVSLTWGPIAMVFTNADTAQGVLEGFAAARAQLARVDNHPPAELGIPAQEQVCRQTLALTWVRRPGYAVVTQEAYSNVLRRTVFWVELHMGPVTWMVMDHVGYHSAVETLQRAHRTAAGVCLDGHRFRADPTRPDYTLGPVADGPEPATPALRGRRR